MNFGFDRSELMGAFLEEVDEQIQLLEQGLLRLEDHGDSPEVIQSLFRVAHTLKGSSAAMGFEEMKLLVHKMEDVLEQLRQGRLSVTRQMVDILFQCLDRLQYIRNEVVSGGGIQTDTRSVIEALHNLLTDGVLTIVPPSGPRESLVLDEEQASQVDDAIEKGRHVWICEVDINPACEMKFARAHLVLRQLHDMGTVIATLPDLHHLEIDDSQVGQVTYLLDTHLDPDELDQTIREFVDIQAVRIKPFIRQAVGTVTAEMVTIDQPPSVPKDIKRTVHMVRVDVDRLEQLMNLVGELVIDQTRIAQAGKVLRDRYRTDETVGDMEQISHHLIRVVGELQESVMKIRMLPIEQLFNRFPRLVRDLAHSLEKEVHLELVGQETELDRTVIEEISDPLIHLIRNALDHGIEPVEDRKIAGKPTKGTLRIAASHQENQVVITIEDDGAGIDPQKIKASAIRKGIISEQEAEGLTDHDAIQLIYRPGFSTAENISDVSGRGVGMDIVREHIEKLNGLIDVESRVGKGTKFTIKLPLTLAIITGLLVKFGKHTYVLPMGSVVEIVRVPEEEINLVKGQPMAVVRERALPVVWLHDYFGFRRSDRQKKHLSIVIVGVAEKRLGLVVDELIGNQEIVVKPLGSYIGKVEGISGVTILGDGNVAPILDVVGVARLIDSRNAAAGHITV
ncbi:chemotaxis protein CheA [Alicyclobacillus contaminans]|uniref:chemotaxis protein CheA n=1 Tax=Alicyclobacillus contaminans TaxID=392016 RepID=UPI00041AE3E7|nr:chemotaxis protein CheA [Alicyclobacillus contaminans]GMA48937.1 chemotaxis protein CheA [Alicyclobacillus contaminans]